MASISGTSRYDPITSLVDDLFNGFLVRPLAQAELPQRAALRLRAIAEVFLPKTRDRWLAEGFFDIEKEGPGELPGEIRNRIPDAEGIRET